MRRIQRMRIRPQRATEPKPAREMRQQNRTYTARS